MIHPLTVIFLQLGNVTITCHLLQSKATSALLNSDARISIFLVSNILLDEWQSNTTATIKTHTISHKPSAKSSRKLINDHLGNLYKLYIKVSATKTVHIFSL